MTPAMRKLVELGSPALGPEIIDVPADVPAGLEELIRAKNGFLAFESALLIRPVFDSGPVRGMHEWNARHGWRSAFGPAAQGLFFFAQDAFGYQFAFKSSGIVRFNPETGAHMPIGSSIEEWVRTLLLDHRDMTGWPVAHEWQCEFGALRPGYRLAPKRPFVLGGEYASYNLIAEEDEQLMRNFSIVYDAIRDLPDGASVSIPNWPYEI
jgi:hypothetical protein